MGIQPSVVRKGIQPIKPSGLINPMGFTNIFRVGLSPTQFLLFQATWRHHKRWIKMRDASRVDTVDARTTGSPIMARAY